jgi:exonuclease III
MPLNFRFGTWNVYFMTRGEQASRSKVTFLKTFAWDVLALQEVTESAWAVFQELELGSSYLHAFDYAPDSKRSAMSHGAALIARHGLELTEPRLFDGLPKPERGLGATVQLGHRKIKVGSWHAPNASGDGVDVKMQGYRGFTNWVTSQQGPCIVGFDSNHWERSTDLKRPYIPPSDDPFLLENLTFSQNPPHQLRDAFIEYLKNNDEMHASIVGERPTGPLEVTYMRKEKGKPIPERMDYIFMSEAFKVIDVAHHFERSIAAGSDHALVTSDLSLSTSERGHRNVSTEAVIYSKNGHVSDEPIHQGILNNQDADRDISQQAVRRAIEDGMSESDAENLYGYRDPTNDSSPE